VNVRRAARRRAASRAAGLRGDIKLLRGGRSAEPEVLRGRIARSAGAIEETLALGLDFGFSPDPELGRWRGHARNIARAIRGEIEGGRLAEASRLAAELIDTIGWIQRHAPEADAAAAGGPWAATWSGRVLGLAARSLPPHLRRDFVEDQCGNLCAAASRRERARYLLGVLARMPRLAAEGR